MALAIGQRGGAAVFRLPVRLQPTVAPAGRLARVGEGDLSARVEVGSNDEFGELSAGFNRMAQTLQGLYQSLEARGAREDAAPGDRARAPGGAVRGLGLRRLGHPAGHAGAGLCAAGAARGARRCVGRALVRRIQPALPAAGLGLPAAAGGRRRAVRRRGRLFRAASARRPTPRPASSPSAPPPPTRCRPLRTRRFRDRDQRAGAAARTHGGRAGPVLPLGADAERGGSRAARDPGQPPGGARVPAAWSRRALQDQAARPKNAACCCANARSRPRRACRSKDPDRSPRDRCNVRTRPASSASLPNSTPACARACPTCANCWCTSAPAPTPRTSSPRCAPRCRSSSTRPVSTTHLTIEGDALPLPPDVQVQVLHVVQEALSNVRKHAQRARGLGGSAGGAAVARGGARRRPRLRARRGRGRPDPRGPAHHARAGAAHRRRGGGGVGTGLGHVRGPDPARDARGWLRDRGTNPFACWWSTTTRCSAAD